MKSGDIISIQKWILISVTSSLAALRYFLCGTRTCSVSDPPRLSPSPKAPPLHKAPGPLRDIKPSCQVKAFSILTSVRTTQDKTIFRVLLGYCFIYLQPYLNLRNVLKPKQTHVSDSKVEYCTFESHSLNSWALFANTCCCFGDIYIIFFRYEIYSTWITKNKHLKTHLKTEWFSSIRSREGLWGLRTCL